MLRSGVNFVLGLAWLWCLLAEVSGKAQLPASGLRYAPTSASHARRLPPNIPQDPTEAFYAGQRMAVAPSTLPLYIKLLNGQQGSKQAAELQFGNHHNANNGNYPISQPDPLLADPLNSQGQNTVGLTQTISASPALASPAVDLGSGEPVAVVAPEPSLSSAPVTNPFVDESRPVLSTPPLFAAPETAAAPAPLGGVPVAAHVSGVPQETSFAAGASEDPLVVASSIQKPLAVTGNTLNSSEGKVQSGQANPGLFRHMPVMYRLPSLGAGQQDGHYIIIMPDHKTKSIIPGSSSGKVRDVTVYLATGVRALRPHQHDQLGINILAGATAPH
ncbi:uncharacterized protein LOC127004056 [Eriocheir sinensis]|uniref:uncharacterized protein LOC127004056 n=1 Tax=Eriocheir sinensis TaxID=95602 RepID=UPI0021C9EE8A|nr:uncharacterized protein LOC127004056 [Eriocheir sinensis]